MRMMSQFRSARLGRRLLVRFGKDRRGVAAVEFAFIVPLMLVLLFGMIDTSSGVAINRKVTLTARTVSDLVSQGATVSSTDLSNFFKMGSAVMTPYQVTTATLEQRVSAVSVDASKNAKVVWSYKAAVNGGTATVTKGYEAGATVTTIPANLLVANTQLIWSEVTYNYIPIVGYVLGKAVIPLSEDTFTRPRQSNKVDYTS
ncbi:MAG: TadE/TadG family type IV pilus assembly protein [Pseudomonadota bacterium]